MNANWPRWLYASVADAMKGVAADLELPCLVETIDERTEAFVHSKAHVEVRITGPMFTNPSSGYYTAKMVVNVLLSQRDEDVQNSYDILKWAGEFATALQDPIPAWNYGGQEGDYGDTPMFIGCLSPSANSRVLNFGQVTVQDRTNQVEVENSFVIELND